MKDDAGACFSLVAAERKPPDEPKWLPGRRFTPSGPDAILGDLLVGAAERKLAVSLEKYSHRHLGDAMMRASSKLSNPYLFSANGRALLRRRSSVHRLTGSNQRP